MVSSIRSTTCRRRPEHSGTGCSEQPVLFHKKLRSLFRRPVPTGRFRQ
ncbi:hypothetical protein RHECNPAF_3500047 [Rhizobium etli CNPAF512]|nr:hypothetical protein RHECNPAF_3500047 [Rhizobium etli CNPAF512]